MSTSEYNKIFGFRRASIQGAKDLKLGIEEFLKGDKSILRLDFSKVSFDYQVREILVRRSLIKLRNRTKYCLKPFQCSKLPLMYFRNLPLIG